MKTSVVIVQKFSLSVSFQSALLKTLSDMIMLVLGRLIPRQLLAISCFVCCFHSDGSTLTDISNDVVNSVQLWSAEGFLPCVLA